MVTMHMWAMITNQHFSLGASPLPLSHSQQLPVGVDADHTHCALIARTWFLKFGLINP